MFRLTMLPASDGDLLVLGWGRAASPHHALVDLGRSRDYRAARAALAGIGSFELLVISHIDADHIEGAVPMLDEVPLAFACEAVWFNGREQLRAADRRVHPGTARPLGALQAEKVSLGIGRAGWKLNPNFGSRIVSTDSPEAASPIEFPGNLKITLVSPTDQRLVALIADWDKELERARLRLDDSALELATLGRRKPDTGRPDVERLAAAAFDEDDTKANGSAIAFVAEYAGRRILCAADAHPGVLVQGLQRLGASERKPLKLDCLKVSHHGSKANTSPALLRLVDCTRFAFSTDGSRHGHPDAEAIARILAADPGRPKELVFNFRQPSSARWDDEQLMKEWSYVCRFPEDGEPGIAIDIPSS